MCPIRTATPRKIPEKEKTTMSTPFVIQTDVPMPGARNRYPFETMPAGASFEIEGEEEARKVRNAAYQYAKKVNKALAVKAAEGELGRKLTSDERAAVEPVSKGTDGAVEFALRKLRSADTGEVDAEGKAIQVHTYGLWRVA